MGGVAVNGSNNIVIAGAKTIECYRMEGEFVSSFSDVVPNLGDKYGNQDFELIRKEIAVGVEDSVFVSDANTNSVRGERLELLLLCFDNSVCLCCTQVISKSLCLSLMSQVILGYSSKGELLFTYGHQAPHILPIIHPRGISTDKFGHVLICDASSPSVSCN